MAEGRITRGTTGTNRLRRVDRYLAALPVLRTAAHPLVVDLGFGARAWTTLEMADRLTAVRPDVRVLGLEIDRERVAAVVPFARDGVDFAFGGFEVPTPDRRPVTLIRAMNVLRQYEESEVPAAWERMRARLEPNGVLLDGTCDEIGRIGSWIDVGPAGPARFTISLRLTGLESPGAVAARLPKALIHRNVPGERIHALLEALDAAWQRASPLGVYGPIARFAATVADVRAAGWPVLSPARRIRLGELTVPWASVEP
jgi:hypothetical protein